MIGLHGVAIFLIIVATAFAVLRVLRSARRHRAWLVLGQVLASGLLYLLLFPPAAPVGDSVLTVVTPGATPQQLAGLSSPGSIVLPGVATAVDSRLERSPDLAAALRRHPGTTQLKVLGHGLPARDRDAARTLSIRFEPAPLPDGIVELALPASVQAGNRWRVAGRVQSAQPGGMAVELRDPADAVAATTKTDAQGRFHVDGLARVSGVAAYTLRLVDASGTLIERIPLHVDARSDPALRLLVLAAVPSPELKYLRRWAIDAGLVVDSRIGLSDGVSLDSGGATAIDADLLAKQDLLVIDERRWLQLDAATRSAITTAVDGGLGLLLRVTGPLSPELLASWSALGIDVQPLEAPAPVVLADDERDDAIAFNRFPYRLPANLAGIVTARNGEALIGWQARGRGRIGISVLADSYRNVLGGHPDRHGSRWSRVATTLARASAALAPQLPTLARVGERVSLCGLDGDGWQVMAEDATATQLIVDASDSRCAAYWPASTGSHRLQQGDTTWSFDVLADDQAKALHAAETVQATQAMAGSTAANEPTAQVSSVPRTVWLLAWLLVMTALWWIERRERAPGSD